MILRALGFAQIVTRLAIHVWRLTVRAHDATPSGDALIKQLLHQRFLIDPARQANAVALPIRLSPFWLVRQLQAFDVTEQFGITGGDCPTTSYQFRQPFKLFAANRGLNVRHPIIEADDKVVFEDNLCRIVPNRIRHAHAVLPQQPELAVELWIRRREHSTFTGRYNLARME